MCEQASNILTDRNLGVGLFNNPGKLMEQGSAGVRKPALSTRIAKCLARKATLNQIYLITVPLKTLLVDISFDNIPIRPVITKGLGCPPIKLVYGKMTKPCVLKPKRGSTSTCE